jgi:hypothetical protein
MYNASIGQDMNKNSYGGFAENGNSKGSVQNSDLGRLIMDIKENSDCK